MKHKKSAVWLTVLVALLLCACGSADDVTLPNTDPTWYSEPETTVPTEPEPALEENEEIAEDPGIPFVTKYIVLSYPSEMEDMVTIEYEDLQDGQQIIFTTEFTGEKLELFRFSISRSGTDGYHLGVLTDEEAGELLVCVDVKEYSSGSWAPEVFARLNAMQERVNDIIVQFYEDPRFSDMKS